jgi:hypothetical protein
MSLIVTALANDSADVIDLVFGKGFSPENQLYDYDNDNERCLNFS